MTTGHVDIPHNFVYRLGTNCLSYTVALIRLSVEIDAVVVQSQPWSPRRPGFAYHKLLPFLLLHVQPNMLMSFVGDQPYTIMG